MSLLHIEKQDRIALLKINRPQVLNALNRELIEALDQAFRDLAEDREIGAVILTGEGPKAFVAGADIRELAALDAVSAKRMSRLGQSVFRRIQEMPKPVIAAINGFALGGGCELALSCHLRVASSNAKLGLPEVSLGLIPGYGGTQKLARLVGRGLALELILTGDMIAADRAYQIGLVNHVTPPEGLLDKCRELANAILSRAPLAVGFALDAVHHGADMAEADGERLESGLFGLLTATRDTKEGLAAFLEKRQAQFHGR